MTVTQLSTARVVLSFFIQVVVAVGISFALKAERGISPWITFPASLGCLFGLVSLLLLRNSRWGIDNVAVYRGLRLKKIFEISEMEGARIGIPVPRSHELIAGLPKVGKRVGALNDMQSSALVIKLKGSRWFVWYFMGMDNDEAFITRVLQTAPQLEIGAVPDKIKNWFPLTVGRIVAA